MYKVELRVGVKKCLSTYLEERTRMATTAPLEPIPHPPGHLFVGHLFDLDANHPIESMMDLAREYGPIFQIDMPGGNSRVVVSGFQLVDELCDESRFDKMLGPGLRALGAGPLGRGLFTSETTDPNWHNHGPDGAQPHQQPPRVRC